MARGGSRGVGKGVCILLPTIFKNIFDVYKFSIISNLFDSDKFYARSIENVRTKCIVFGEALRIRVKQFKQNFREIIKKTLK